MIKRIIRVEYATDTYVTFDTANSLQETEQGLWNSFMDLTGADYAYDMIGTGRAARKNAIERVSFTIVESTAALVETAFAALETNLQGRIILWRCDGLDPTAMGAVNEWAYARLVNMPMRSLNVDHNRHMPVTLIFERISDWTVGTP
jgi:hypothetical protein